MKEHMELINSQFRVTYDQASKKSVCNNNIYLDSICQIVNSFKEPFNSQKTIDQHKTYSKFSLDD